MRAAGQDRCVRIQAWVSILENLAYRFRATMGEFVGPDYLSSHAPHSWNPHLKLRETSVQVGVYAGLAGTAREEIDVRAVDTTPHVSGTRRTGTRRMHCSSPNPAQRWIETRCHRSFFMGTLSELTRVETLKIVSPGSRPGKTGLASW